jgi:UPF0176 protein
MSEEKKYFVIAFYIFTSIEDPKAEVAKHHAFFKDRDITSRIYISETGINAQMSALKEHALEYIAWMQQDDRFKDIDFKLHTYHEQVFPRATVKYRKQLVALDHNADPHKCGDHLSSEEWKKMLQGEEQVLLLDVRNDYEWKIGHFKGAVKPPLDVFRKFPEYAKQLTQEYNTSSTKVLMYCTGGIRCELYSALMKDVGFENVYQLQGGVIRYGLEQGQDLWEGKLFVFDDRLSIPISEKEEPKAPISTCKHCSTACDVYYNCANMDCNELFLSCPACAEKLLGCCQESCKCAPRIRAFASAEKPKPFRRKHLCGCA